ncbi:MAG: protein kinase, partial [Tannerellaceae bacterium]|nr:protein kinase [Tannerellaceae bacterium]
ANLLLTGDGTAKVADFGLAGARALLSAGLSTIGGRGGTMVSESGYYTPAYCSPEQEAGATLTRRTDIWSWAICVLEMFLGDHFWFNGTAAGCACEDYFEMELKVPLTKSLKDLLLWCFELKEAERPHDFTLIDTELQKIYRAAAGTPYPRPPRPGAPDTTDSRNNRALSFLDIGRPEEAEKCWEEALAIDSSHADSLYNRSLYLWRNAKIDDLEALRLIESNAIHAEYYLALLHIARSDMKSAMKYFRRAREAEGETERIAKALVAIRQIRKEKRDTRCLRIFPDEMCHGTNSVCFSSDGRQVLSGYGNGSIRLWDTATGKCIRTFREHANVIKSFSLSPGGQWVLSGGWDKAIRLWDTTTGECIRTFTGHTGEVESVCFSPDGQRALSGSQDKTIRLWNTATGECMRIFTGHTGGVESVCFSPDGQRVLSGSWDKTSKLWDAATGECIRTFIGYIDSGYTSSVFSVCFSSGGQWALSGSEYGHIWLWDTATGKCIRTFTGHTFYILSVCFSPGEQWVFSGSYDGSIRVWDTATGKCIRTWKEENNIKSVCFSPDGQKMLLSVSYIGDMRLYRLPQAGTAEMLLSRIHSIETTAKRRTLFLSLADETKALIEKKDIAGALNRLEKLRAERFFGDSLTYSRLAGEIARYCVQENTLINQVVQVIETGQEEVWLVCFSPDNRFVLSGTEKGKLWDTATGKCIRTFEFQKNTDEMRAACFSPDGQRILSIGFFDETIRLWDTATGECIRTFGIHTDSVYSLCFSPDGQKALSGNIEKTIRLWDTATGECIRTFEADTHSVYSACFSPDGRQILSGGWDQTIRLWDTATGKYIRNFYGHTHDIESLCFSPDGQKVLSGGGDHTIRLWDMATRECIRIWEGHTRPAKSVCFSPNGQWVLSGSRDCTIRLWDTATGECLRTWKEKGYIDSVCFSPDGTRIVAAVKNEIHIYHLEFALHFPGWADWDEGAQPYLDIFRTLHPNYTEKDVQRFLTELQYRGYGWLRPEGVRKRLASR